MGCNCGNKNKTVVSTIPNMDTCSCGKPISECCKTTGKQCGCHHEQKPCLADHTQTLVDSVYTTTVTATDTWVMPAVDDCVQLHLKDVTNILPGAILWNNSVGSLHVSSYDATTGYVTACNEGEEGNAEAGSDFPSCMAFHVGVPIECDCSDNWTGPCLAADVTSPGVGETTEVVVTTVSGLFIGDIIDIAGFMYKIVAINDVHTIVVKNEGFGAPLGTVIKNDPNCTGKPCTVKITVVNSDDPCAKDPVHEGVLIVCEDGERKPFEGTADNQITYWDNDDKKWKLKIVKLTEECTNLTVDLTLDPLVTVYVVTVAKTSIFKVGDEVFIDDIKFTVNAIINSTQMRITIAQAVAQITVIEEGSSICLGDCCIDKVSGVVTVPNSINYVDINYPFTKLQSSDLDDTANRSTTFTKTITFSTPVSGKTVTLVGTINLAHNSSGYADTHYYNFSGGNWSGQCYTVPPRVCLSGNISVTDSTGTTTLFPTQEILFNSVGIRRPSIDPAETSIGNRPYGSQTINGLFTYGAFYCTPNNNDGIGCNGNTTGSYATLGGDTKTSTIPISQSLNLPVSITVKGGETVTINISGKIILLNARGILPDSAQAWTDEVVAMQVRQTNIIASLIWIVQ